MPTRTGFTSCASKHGLHRGWGDPSGGQVGCTAAAFRKSGQETSNSGRNTDCSTCRKETVALGPLGSLKFTGQRS